LGGGKQKDMNWSDGIVCGVLALELYLVLRGWLDMKYRGKLRERSWEKYELMKCESKDVRLQLNNIRKLNDISDLHMKMMDVSTLKVYLMFWKPIKSFYKDMGFPTEDEIKLLRLQK
jgi:hypothetical protein